MGDFLSSILFLKPPRWGFGGLKLGTCFVNTGATSISPFAYPLNPPNGGLSLLDTVSKAPQMGGWGVEKGVETGIK
jgi:hypothetical protein